MAGLTELRDLQALSPRDGQSSDLDEGMAAYSRAHRNPCPAVPPLTDAARLRLATEALRRRAEAKATQEAQAAVTLQDENAAMDKRGLATLADVKILKTLSRGHRQHGLRPITLSSWRKSIAGQRKGQSTEQKMCTRRQAHR
jgi:hypothetical protein